MDYPKEIPAVKSALDQLAYSPANGLTQPVTAGLIDAASQPSIVPACHAVIATLRPVKDSLKAGTPNTAALTLLAGALYLCVSNQWAPVAGVAPYAATLAEVQAFLAEIDPPTEPE